MPTHISEREAKKIKAREAQARAKQWRDEMRAAKSPGAATRKAPAKIKAASTLTKPAPSLKKRTIQERTPQSTEKKSNKAVDVTQGEEEALLLYRKTPSWEDRAKARASAREWSNQRKKKKEVYEVKEVPSVVETNNKREEEELTISDDFKTAHAAESPNAPRASGQIDENHVKELWYLKNDVDNVSNRIQSICDVLSAKVDTMDCD